MRYLPAVNQKRAYAQLLMQQAGREEHRHLRMALLQGSVLHLHQAVIFYQGEVAETYQCREPESATTPEALIALLAASDKSPVEAQELAALAADPDSWLSHLRRSVADIRLPQQPTKPVQSDDLIAVRDADLAQSELNEEQVAAWISRFVELVERHRETMVEF